MSWLLAFKGQLLKCLWGLISWVPKRLHLVQQEKKEAEREVPLLLERYRASLEEQLAKVTDPERKQALEEEIEGTIAAERGYYRKMVEVNLERAGLPPYGALVANGKRVLEPESRARLSEALEHLDLLPLPPTADDFMASANANYVLERYKEALAAYDRALALQPDWPAALNNRGLTYRHLQQYEQALADYDRALQLRPDDLEALNNRGNTYNCLERYDEALADYNRALQLRSDFPEALSNRGATHAKLGRYKEALADLDRALQLRPDHANPFYNMACVLSLMHRTEDAIAYLEKAINRDKKSRQDAATDTDFDNIRDDPRFQKLIERD